MTRTTRSWRDVRRGEGDPDREQRVREHRRAMEDALALNELRESVGATQVELAGRMGVNQGNVSRLERRDDLYLSTLREYVRALGGDLKLVAEFPDGSEVLLEPKREPAAVR